MKNNEKEEKVASWRKKMLAMQQADVVGAIVTMK